MQKTWPRAGEWCGGKREREEGGSVAEPERGEREVSCSHSAKSLQSLWLWLRVGFARTREVHSLCVCTLCVCTLCVCAWGIKHFIARMSKVFGNAFYNACSCYLIRNIFIYFFFCWSRFRLNDVFCIRTATPVCECMGVYRKFLGK